jgi:hypothetical protein
VKSLSWNLFILVLFFLLTEIETMPTGNFDSSLLTARRQAKAVAANAADIAALQALNPGATNRVLQLNNQSAALVIEKNLGACYCNGQFTASTGPGNSCGCRS